jgi:hypothetical protein
MNAKEKIVDSTSDLVEDKYKTLPKLDPVGIIGDITQQRINSFLQKPTVESDGEEELNNKEQLATTVSFVPIDRKAIALIPKSPIIHKTFSSLKSWEGFVIKKYNEYFTARMTDLTEKSPDEEVEIMLTDVSGDDLPLVVPGAIFYWHVGYEIDKGTTKRSSIIRFRRMPRWSQSDFKKANSLKRKIKELFKL